MLKTLWDIESDTDDNWEMSGRRSSEKEVLWRWTRITMRMTYALILGVKTMVIRNWEKINALQIQTKKKNDEGEGNKKSRPPSRGRNETTCATSGSQHRRRPGCIRHLGGNALTFGTEKAY